MALLQPEGGEQRTTAGGEPPGHSLAGAQLTGASSDAVWFTGCAWWTEG
jgi:hypothetical protein